MGIPSIWRKRDSYPQLGVKWFASARTVWRELLASVGNVLMSMMSKDMSRNEV